MTRIGDILKSYNIISDEDIKKALELQRKTGYLFGEALLSLNLCKEEEVKFAIYKQIENNKISKNSGLNFKVIYSLFKEFKNYKLLLVVIIIFSLFSALFSETIIIPFVLGFIIDQLIVGENLNQILIFITLGIAGYIIGLIFEFILVTCTTLFTSKLSSNLLNKLYQHLNSIPYVFFMKYNKGDITNRFTDNIEEISRVIQFIMSSIFLNLFLFIIILVSLIMFNLIITIFTIILLIISLILPSLISNRANIFVNNAPFLLGKISSFLKEALIAFKFVKTNHKTEAIIGKLEKMTKEYYKNDYGKWINWNISFNIKVSLNILILGSVMFFGGYLIINGKLNIGFLLSYYLIISRFFSKMDYFYYVYLVIQSLKSNWLRINQLFHIPKNPEETNIIQTDSIKIENEISFNNVSFGYLKGSTIINQFNIKFKKGNKYVIIGKSGSGKSTILKLIMGIYKPNNGEILIDNKNYDNITMSVIWNNISYMDQFPFIFENKTIYENIILGLPEKLINSIKTEDIIIALKKAKIYDLIESLPKKIDTVIGKDNIEFSGGERQRLALARIFLRNSEIIVLDEPTSSLDKENSDLIINTIMNEYKDKIVILSTHSLNHTSLFSNMIIFYQNEIKIVENDFKSVDILLKKYIAESRTIE
ncbi:MAG: hypothetical protein A2086_02610 [Spirochaetes bacterium GWD1_27_9]|nr:MAG: hypothetical protein A2Z98_17275 [Spirochaetes bacterium GWB1_27_13]OHD27741.1 MAG: hypothetical protein A2Y34_08910 [Spirochaetes bacterium GWC1_27_15]OHD33947.1 MAG: hypothetical protein A2086_02610 [Spirochaetes bacterium GWD1_27_9]